MSTSVIIMIVVIILLSAAVGLVGMKLWQGKVKKLLSKTPDTEKIRLNTKAEGLLIPVTIMVDSVDGKTTTVGN